MRRYIAARLRHMADRISPEPISPKIIAVRERERDRRELAREIVKQMQVVQKASKGSHVLITSNG